MPDSKRYRDTDHARLASQQARARAEHLLAHYFEELSMNRWNQDNAAGVTSIVEEIIEASRAIAFADFNKLLSDFITQREKQLDARLGNRPDPAAIGEALVEAGIAEERVLTSDRGKDFEDGVAEERSLAALGEDFEDCVRAVLCELHATDPKSIGMLSFTCDLPEEVVKRALVVLVAAGRAAVAGRPNDYSYDIQVVTKWANPKVVRVLRRFL